MRKTPAIRRVLGVCLLSLACAPFAAGPLTAQSARVYEVLHLNSYDRTYPWSDDIIEGIRSTLDQSNKEIRLSIEYMDTRYHNSPQQFELLREFYGRKYRGRRFDVILASDDNAFTFLCRNAAELFPGTPVVFCGLNTAPLSGIPRRDLFTGLVESTDWRETVDFAMIVHPRTRHHVIIYDDRSLYDYGPVHRETVRTRYPEVQAVYLDTSQMDFGEMLTRLRTVPPDSIVFLTAVQKAKGGRRFGIPESTRMIAEASPAPIYGFNSNLLGHGIVGGRLNSGVFQGEAASRMALSILDGVSPAAIPISTTSPNRYMFDHVQLERWGIGTARLPPDRIVIHEPPPVYERYKRLIWATALFLAFQTAVISLLLVNIARRRKAERMLKASQRVLSKGQSIANIGSWEQSLDEGSYAFSEQAFRIFDLPRGSGRIPLGAFLDRIHPEDREAVRELNERARKEGGRYRAEYRIVRPDGTERYAREESEAVSDETGRTRHLAGTLQDITEWRHLEEQLRQSQKMDAVGQLAGGIAHDFNNLLTAINGYSELVLGGLEPGTPTHENLQEIRKAGDRAAALTQQLLAFSRKQMLKPTIFDLNRAVADMNNILVRVIGEDVRLVTATEPGDAMVRADIGQIEQVILNLAVNARDAMPHGGTLSIGTSRLRMAKNGPPLRADLTEGSYIVLSVRDDGIGMDSAIQARIFEPFFTTKPPGKGTGLGLSTAYGIVKQSGGTMSVESQPGEGSRFDIYLPEAVESAAAPEIAPGDRRGRGGLETILLVEDEPAVRTLARKILQKEGYRVLEAANAEEAIEISKRYDDGIQLLVTDAVMPGMDGIELTGRLAGTLPHMKVLYISGYAENAGVREGLLDRRASFLPKPFTPDDLRKKVRTLLD